MAEVATQTKEIWDSVLRALGSDERITPQLRGFLGLVEPKGVMAGTMYLEVPNDFTRGMLAQRLPPRLAGAALAPAAARCDRLPGAVARDREFCGGRKPGHRGRAGRRRE